MGIQDDSGGKRVWALKGGVRPPALFQAASGGGGGGVSGNRGWG